MRSAFCGLSGLGCWKYTGLCHDLRSFAGCGQRPRRGLNTVPSRLLKLALQRQKKKQILKEKPTVCQLRAGYGQAAPPPKLVPPSHHTKKENAFGKYIFSQCSNNTIVRLLYGENTARREDPGKFSRGVIVFRRQAVSDVIGMASALGAPAAHRSIRTPGRRRWRAAAGGWPRCGLRKRKA